jgi:hypothetical protein
MMVGKVNLQQHFGQHWRVAVLRKYTVFDVLITGCSESKVCRFRRK